MSDPILSVEGLQVNYGRVEAVRNVSFDVAAGALVTLVGANGAGKTSVLNAVSGLLRARRGVIRFKGQDITKWPAHRLVKAGLVQVPEGREVLGTLTVAENLSLGGWHRGSTLHRNVAGVYERFPVLFERRKLQAGALSGGEQQMLSIARALIAEPEILLLDEPSMGLAPLIVDEVFAVIEEIRLTGTTVVLVEQNARRALAAADFGYVLETGEITHSGPAHELLADERVIEAYLGLD
ncbi:MAG: ABC transporter ATP-binding protein [Cryobacterium sp.]|uniref:ABC transporter ATP-binding protein n=1 Tax=unclassified Cryobacterium TaxID=2649013 RepID=UPI0018C9B20C|nr:MULTISPECIES: ABC transporter ATP-binding protein [unclassified Cryobacterium]MCY7404064.1 ABC transporter ATP-binding protein [Cryobacterium sp.]MEC5154311.1 branched-chain amino acid transport system ATP-binding protein [Cryobacterium sp. CAN_C3]